jgi:hypothetical protein
VTNLQPPFGFGTKKAGAAQSECERAMAFSFKSCSMIGSLPLLFKSEFIRANLHKGFVDRINFTLNLSCVSHLSVISTEGSYSRFSHRFNLL